MQTLQQWGLLKLLDNHWDKQLLVAVAALDKHR
jgi:hypothetical protein